MCVSHLSSLGFSSLHSLASASRISLCMCVSHLSSLRFSCFHSLASASRLSLCMCVSHLISCPLSLYLSVSPLISSYQFSSLSRVAHSHLIVCVSLFSHLLASVAFTRWRRPVASHCVCVSLISSLGINCLHSRASASLISSGV